jgi:hypothetical protein
MQDILTLAEAARELGLKSADGLRTQVHRGRLTARLIGKTWVITRDELERYRARSLGQVGRPSLVDQRPPFQDVLGKPGEPGEPNILEDLAPGSKER